MHADIWTQIRSEPNGVSRSTRAPNGRGTDIDFRLQPVMDPQAALETKSRATDEPPYNGWESLLQHAT